MNKEKYPQDYNLLSVFRQENLHANSNFFRRRIPFFPRLHRASGKNAQHRRAGGNRTNCELSATNRFLRIYKENSENLLHFPN